VIAADVADRPQRESRVLYAPGIDVFTLTPRGNYDVVSGSSIAAAEVSAVATLLLAQQPNLKPQELGALLRTFPPGVAGGSVNACLALRELHRVLACSDAGPALARRQ
jgi:subtilisin family serine protease